VITDVSIPSTIAVYGNGKELGLIDDIDLSITSINGYYAVTNYSGVAVGTSINNNSRNARKSIGITTDSSKSGIIAKSDSITTTSKSFKFCIKY
jgi:hypothetical protein